MYKIMTGVLGSKVNSTSNAMIDLNIVISTTLMWKHVETCVPSEGK